jgi:hypothetical protein
MALFGRPYLAVCAAIDSSVSSADRARDNAPSRLCAGDRGKLTIVGGGWNITAPPYGPTAVAVHIQVPQGYSRRGRRPDVAGGTTQHFPFGRSSRARARLGVVGYYEDYFAAADAQQVSGGQEVPGSNPGAPT